MVRIVDQFSGVTTAEGLRAITLKQIREKLEVDEEIVSVVRTENARAELLRLADKKEIVELEKTFLGLMEGALKTAFPTNVVESRRIKGYPCILLWPKDKWEGVNEDE